MYILPLLPSHSPWSQINFQSYHHFPRLGMGDPQLAHQKCQAFTHSPACNASWQPLPGVWVPFILHFYALILFPRGLFYLAHRKCVMLPLMIYSELHFPQILEALKVLFNKFFSFSHCNRPQIRGYYRVQTKDMYTKVWVADRLLSSQRLTAFYFLKKKIFFFMWCGMWDFSSLTRNQKGNPCLGSMES